MNTISDFKKRIACALETRETVKAQLFYNGQLTKDFGSREVCGVNTVGFSLFTKKDDGSVRPSYCNWPKKAELSFDGQKAIITFEGNGRLEYTFQE